jgi:hypothetical protein
MNVLTGHSQGLVSDIEEGGTVSVPDGSDAVFEIVLTDESGDPIGSADVTVSVHNTILGHWDGVPYSYKGDGVWRAVYDTSKIGKLGSYEFKVSAYAPEYKDPDAFQGTLELVKSEEQEWYGDPVYLAGIVSILAIIGFFTYYRIEEGG